MQLLRGRTTGVETLAISPDSRFVVAVGCGTGCDIWDINEAKSKVRWLRMAGGITRRVDFQTPTDLLGFDGSNWCRHDLVAGTRIILDWQNIVQPHNAIVHQLGVLFKTARYNRDSNIPPRGTYFSTLAFSRDNFEPVATENYAIGFHRLICFRPTGECYLVSDSSLTTDEQEYYRRYHLRDTATDQVAATFELSPLMSENSPHQWAFTPDGRWLFAVDYQNIATHDCDAGGPPTLVYSVAPGSQFNAIAVHPGGRMLATVEDHRTVTLRDADTVQPLRSYDFAMPRVTCVAFTPDGTHCVVGNSRGKVLLFDVE